MKSTLRVDAHQRKCLEEYSTLTGQKVNDCLYDALDTWIRTVAATQVNPISQLEKYPVVLMPHSNLIM
jgi:hypothetical protein